MLPWSRIWSVVYELPRGKKKIKIRSRREETKIQWENGAWKGMVSEKVFEVVKCFYTRTRVLCCLQVVASDNQNNSLWRLFLVECRRMFYIRDTCNLQKLEQSSSMCCVWFFHMFWMWISGSWRTFPAVWKETQLYKCAIFWIWCIDMLFGGLGFSIVSR